MALKWVSSGRGGAATAEARGASCCSDEWLDPVRIWEEGPTSAGGGLGTLMGAELFLLLSPGWMDDEDVGSCELCEILCCCS